MERYRLQSDETVLYEGNVHKIEKYEKKSIMASFNTTSIVELLLTNKNIVLTTRMKKMFSKEQLNIEIYPLSDIKIYEEMPQIKLNKLDAEIYLTSGELYLTFISKAEITKFYQSVMKVLTGKSFATRGAEKVKGGIGLVDDTLGINTIGTIKDVLENGVAKTLFFGKKKNQISDSAIKEVAGVAKDVVKEARGNNDTDKKEKEVLNYDQQVDALNKMKALLDAGILTQEEFDAKKKEILGL